MNDQAAASALSALEMPDVVSGEFGYALGLGAIGNDYGSKSALGIGLTYGLSDKSSVYTKGSVSLKSTTSWRAFVGLKGKF